MEIKAKTIKMYEQILESEGLLSSIEIGNFEDDTQISCLTYDSRRVESGAMFICKGKGFKLEYLVNARKAGAVACVCERESDFADDVKPEIRAAADGMCIISVNDMRRAIAVLANFYYDNVQEKLKIVGITATKGKSSSAYFLKHIIDEAKFDKPKTAYITGIDVYDGKLRQEARLTTPETLELHRHFKNAADSGIDTLIMEVSSQALKFHRTLGINFEIAAFLNIGLDHISDSEHRDFEDYFSSKLRIFKQAKIAVINADSEHLQEIIDAASVCNERICFAVQGISDSLPEKTNLNYYAFDVLPSGSAVKFKVIASEKRAVSLSLFQENISKTKLDSDFEIYEFSIRLAGVFNVSNAVSAIAMARQLGISFENIRKGLEKASVPGRMEFFEGKSGNIVLVDYAHNEMSFESLFCGMRKQFEGKKFTVVYGCPGGKALGRRIELPKIAAKYAQMSYITEEDYGSEELEKICEEVAENTRSFGGKAIVVLDREEAIRLAIQQSDEDTIVLVTGKGRETRQKRGNEYVSVESDVEIVRKYINKH